MTDTIAAISTADGAGGIAIVRASGPDALSILKQCFSAKEFTPRRMTYGFVTDAAGEAIDEALSVYLPAPATYTREEMFEIQCHGGRVCARNVLRRVLELGARPAQAGEFTKRAFLAGRVDLAKAEAVMALIGADGEAAARASLRQLRGGVSGFARECIDALTGMLSLITACVDYPEEVEEELVSAELREKIARIVAGIDRGCDEKSARILREGASIVLKGRPNVGKSSLMNALLRQDRAIVTAIPGTTRDTLTERVSFGGILAELTDTAGLRDARDEVERIGVDRARQAADMADIVLLVLDGSQALTDEDNALIAEADERTLICANKHDMPGAVLHAQGAYPVSAATGEGMDALREEISERLKKSAAAGENGMTLLRHIDLAKQARAALVRADEALSMGMSVDAAEIDLKEALEALCGITGESAAEEVIDRVFREFCVGK